MNDLLIGLLGVLLSTNPPVAAHQLLAQVSGGVIKAPASDPVEKEYRAIMEEDDAARAEIDEWIEARNKAGQPAEGEKEAEAAAFRARIRDRLGKVRPRYEGFIEKHPAHAGIRLAYGSFLMETDEEKAGEEQWEKARQLDPSNPAPWNNLANYYGHRSPVTKAFDYYQKAIDLDPTESVYYYNFATTVYLFRRDATNHFGITEAEVFDKAMALYHKALALDPTNFVLASDVAQSYYGIKLPKTDDPEALARAQVDLCDKAIVAWEAALKLARDDIERQGVYVHLARNHINAKRSDQARKYLDQVSHEMFEPTKRTLIRKMEAQK